MPRLECLIRKSDNKRPASLSVKWKIVERSLYSAVVHGLLNDDAPKAAFYFFSYFIELSSCSSWYSSGMSTSRALLPSNGPTMPACCNWSIKRPARL